MKHSRNQKFLSVLLFFFIWTSFIPSSFAFFKDSPWTKEKSYTEKISHKAGFGIMNIGTGWMALLFEPYYAGWKGLATGPFYAVTNTAGGIIHAITFPIPLDVPLPQGGISYEYSR